MIYAISDNRITANGGYEIGVAWLGIVTQPYLIFVNIAHRNSELLQFIFFNLKHWINGEMHPTN